MEKLPLRGYCTPTRKLACFVCFLLHREENQYFLCMVVIDVCDSKSKSMIFFPWIYESLMWNGSKYFFLFNLRNHFKINRINSCFYYSWNHPFGVKKIHSDVKKLLYLIRSGNLKLTPLYDRRLKCP